MALGWPPVAAGAGMADRRSASSRAGRPAPGRLDRIGGLVARRPRRVVVVWLALTIVLGLVGLGLEGKLSTRAVFIDGTSAKRERQIAVEQFGSESVVVVMLRGPRSDVGLQGRRLERRFEAIPGALVLSPWTPGTTIDGLSPSPGVAALVVNVKGRANDDLTAILPAIRSGVDESVGGPVRASVAGGPAIIDSVQKANAQAVKMGELIAIPVLLLILLFVFRSVLAALAPVLVGGSVVIASRGVLSLVASATHIELLALAAMGMMALALGVDYSLLAVSRFREEREAGAEVPEAIQSTVAATGRTVLMAGAGLSLAMVVAAVALPGAVATSVGIAVIIATALSVFSALFVVPALLVLFGSRLERWSLPRRAGVSGASAGWSQRLSSRTRTVVLPMVFVLVFATVWATTLDTGVATVAQLPADDPGRLQQEDVQQALGPGWVAPLEIAMQSADGPVTTPARLRALGDFQRHLERDPGVATMTGFAGIERATRGAGDFDQALVAQQRGLGKLSDGLSRVHRGATLNTSGLAQAANGAERMESVLGATHSGAGALAEGIGTASNGSLQMAKGLGKASSGSDKLAESTAKASEGADSLSAGLARARRQSRSSVSSARVLENAMQEGEAQLGEADGSIGEVESSLTAAREALQAMSVGRGDPQYATTLAAVESAIVWLTGVDPKTGEPAGSTEGAVTGIRRAHGQFDLGLYLSERLEKNGQKAMEGTAKLARGSEKLDDGLEKLASGADRMYAGIARLSRGGRQLPAGLQRLERGTERLADGLGQIQTGSGALADGLGDGAEKSKLLSGALQKMGSGVERQRSDSGGSQLARLHEQAPGLFRSGFFYLASLDGGTARKRQQAAFMVSLERGGSTARMLVIPSYDPADPRAADTRDRLVADAEGLAKRTDTEVVVGGVTAAQLDIDSALRDQTPFARLALALVTILILIAVLRSLLVPILAAVLNLLTVAATFGFLALLFDGSFLGGPGYIDTTVLPATVMVVFGLAIDYEVFVFARMREEYLRTGSAETAISEGLMRTAPVVTGAALIMIAVFLSFGISSFSTMRNFGVAQAIGVAIDAFVIRLIIVPAMMRGLGRWAWWMPRWLDRLLPGTPNSEALRAGARAR
jgi:RND superfamily putative drug exporter